MAYTFSNTQGDRTITVNDNQLDQTSYSLTLLGKNVTNYGERIAENTIRQLENFSSPNQPNPTVKLVGQLWYDKTGEHLRVYTGDSAEKGFEECISWNKLYEKVCKFSGYLKTLGLKKGDRIAAYVPNKIETVISFLAAQTYIYLNKTIYSKDH